MTGLPPSGIKVNGRWIDFTPGGLRTAADWLEDEWAKARQEKRIEELAAELRGLAATPGFAWRSIAAALIADYPALGAE